MLGKEYIIDHVVSVLRQESEAKGFAFFMSEMVRSMTNSIAGFMGGNQYQKSWQEIKNYKPETRTADEVIDHVLDRVKAVKEGYEDNV